MAQLQRQGRRHDPATANGVGGYTVQLRSSTTTPSIVDGARGAAASSSPTLPPATKKAADICFIATAVDALGNESKLPAAGADVCAGTDPTAPHVIQAGVDITAPTIKFSALARRKMTVSCRAISSCRWKTRKMAPAFSMMILTDPDDGPVLAQLGVRDAEGQGDMRQRWPAGE